MDVTEVARPVAAFAASVRAQTPLRAAITAAYRRPEAECLSPLLDAATLTAPAAEAAAARAGRLVTALRAKTRAGGVEGLVREYALSSQEGVALMCLAEALLRIPDAATRDALIRDKIAPGDWRAHVGHSPSLFVNAATWGLAVTGKLTGSVNETSLASALTRLIARSGEPVIRRGVDLAMRMMGEQFVLGQTINEALTRGAKMEARGFRYSYDMLGEAATTEADAARYLGEYETAIHAIGRAAKGRGIRDGAGISINLSALHPRYSRAKIGRVIAELLPRLVHLAEMARGYDIGLNIDAEEADRLDISLDLLEALCHAPALAGWNGIGFVVQAYQKRAPFVLDWVIDLARRTGHRLMLRLVKGAYWDSEIKRAQVDGLDGFPVFTRKAYTDVSYLACARKLLDAPDAVFPQFATHNAQTLSAIMAMAPEPFHAGQYEFQCLHGMGEPLYEEVVGPAKLDRPCRIYAPVGTHETLLAYLVRRLLENGANSSFVNRIADPAVPVSELTIDPVAQVRASYPGCLPHPGIAAPRALFAPARQNSAGLDLSNEQTLATLADALQASAATEWTARPTGGAGRAERIILNPADHRDVVGVVHDTTEAEAASMLARAAAVAPEWAATEVAERAACLARAADLLEARMPVLLGLIVREAGKTLPNAVGEVREAVDFLRYYAAEAERSLPESTPLGLVACISPWNFPLAIFMGQVAAALAAGNAVLAKPAEETPLIAGVAVRLLHEAGIPEAVVQLVPGDGAVGAALVADARVQGVVFTGSTAVARAIQRQLAGRLTSGGMPVPLIAETGGQNALIVDSSALAEQVVGDVIASAFDSAGAAVLGAAHPLPAGGYRRADVDHAEGARCGSWRSAARIGWRSMLGPSSAPRRWPACASMWTPCARGASRWRCGRLPEGTEHGTFMAPTLIEIGAVADVEREVFGPVLHVLRFRRERLDALIDDINATGYALTFGLHTRIDETVARVTKRVAAGNIYVNRNIIGAVVGAQPFGGSGLSGTGPKAGGPLYLRRLVASASPMAVSNAELPGPAGEENLYRLEPRGLIAAIASTEPALIEQVGVILATGNRVLVERGHPPLPPELTAQVTVVEDWLAVAGVRGVLFDGDRAALLALNARLAQRPGPILMVQARGEADYRSEWLVEERSISTNTAAAGGNASLATLI